MEPNVEIWKKLLPTLLTPLILFQTCLSNVWIFQIYCTNGNEFLNFVFSDQCVMDVKIRLVINCMMMLWSVGQTCTSNDKIKEKKRERQKEDFFQLEEIHTKNSHLVNFQLPVIALPYSAQSTLCMCHPITTWTR